VGCDRCSLHVRGSFIEGVHRALRALRGVLGRAEQSTSGRAHGRGTAADAGQELLDIRTKRGDGGIDRGASLLLAADGGALLLGMTLLRHVLMCGDPATAG